jgi:hypothetical protein
MTTVLSLSTNSVLDPELASWSKYVEVSATPDGRLILATYGGTGVTSEGAMTEGSHLLKLDIDCSATTAVYQLSVDGDVWFNLDDTGHPNGFRDAEFVSMGGLSQGAAKDVKLTISTTGSLGGG